MAQFTTLKGPNQEHCHSLLLPDPDKHAAPTPGLPTSPGLGLGAPEYCHPFLLPVHGKHAAATSGLPAESRGQQPRALSPPPPPRLRQTSSTNTRTAKLPGSWPRSRPRQRSLTRGQEHRHLLLLLLLLLPNPGKHAAAATSGLPPGTRPRSQQRSLTRGQEHRHPLLPNPGKHAAAATPGLSPGRDKTPVPAKTAHPCPKTQSLPPRPPPGPRQTLTKHQHQACFPGAGKDPSRVTRGQEQGHQSLLLLPDSRKHAATPGLSPGTRPPGAPEITYDLLKHPPPPPSPPDPQSRPESQQASRPPGLGLNPPGPLYTYRAEPPPRPTKLEFKLKTPPPLLPRHALPLPATILL